MKLLFVIILLSQVSCAAATNFLVSTSSNLLSDSIGREIETETSSDCKGEVK